MDWYRSAQQVCAPRRLAFATDLLESEGHVRLVRPDDEIIPLLNVDRLLVPWQSRLGNLWRNAVKFALLPVQVLLLRRLHKRLPLASYHAHTMYYMLACAYAGVPFVGTPQGSEILVRPKRSRVYRWFARRALRAAETVTVDSAAMQRGVLELSGRPAELVQNGIDVEAIQAADLGGGQRAGVLSIRALTENYRIEDLLKARNASREAPAVTLLYPFWEAAYASRVRAGLRAGDRDLGRLPRDAMYREMARAWLVVSIPTSDSSPRSVYEAIFAGSVVAVTPNAFLDQLPACMRSRVVVVDVFADGWLDAALAEARRIVATPFVPSEDALERFDQRRSMARVARSFYRPPLSVNAR